MVQIIGCSTQRNNGDGLRVSTEVANGTPILISGCAFDSDGVNGTLTTTSGGTPAGSGGYSSPGSGLGHAGIAIGGGSTVILSGVTQTCGTSDASLPCPQYGISTFAIDGYNPVLVSINDSFLNAGSTLIYDQTSVITNVGLSCYGVAGAVFNGQTPSHIPSVITGTGNVLLASTDGTSTSDGAIVLKPGATGFIGIYDDVYNHMYYGISPRLPGPSGTGTMGGFYSGLAVGGATANSGVAIFGALNSSQNNSGLGQAAFTVYDNDKVETFHSMLDDGSGNMTLAGGLAANIRTITSSGAISATDSVVLLNAATLTATLPTAVGITGRQYTVKLIASSTGTVATTSSQHIDASTTYSLSAQYKYVTVVSDGANWQIVANN